MLIELVKKHNIHLMNVMGLGQENLERKHLSDYFLIKIADV